MILRLALKCVKLYCCVCRKLVIRLMAVCLRAVYWKDNSGKMPFIVFEAGIVDKMRSMEGPKVMMVGGMVDINKFSNDMTLQLVLQRMEEIMPEDDITHLLPNGDFDHQEYENKLQKLIKGVMTPGIRLILENIFSGTLYDKFLINPAGMRLHHAYIGGLLQHSVDVAGIAQSLADRIGGVDKDLIVAGALLHDIGKIAVPDAVLNKPAKLTDEEYGIMKNHTVWGGQILSGLEFSSTGRYGGCVPS